MNDLTGNLIWMCVCCMANFNSTKNGSSSETSTAEPTKSIEADVSELKIAVARITDTIASMTKTIPTISPTNNTEQVRQVHSPPDPITLLNGTASSGDTTTTEESLHTTDGDCFSLLPTNIDSSATECDVQWMVSHAIGLTTPEHLDVTKLVSKWKTRCNLDFISFKVVLPSKHKFRALNPATWPKNVRFREFVRITDTWKPNIRLTDH